jgi:hypothetical protein
MVEKMTNVGFGSGCETEVSIPLIFSLFSPSYLMAKIKCRLLLKETCLFETKVSYARFVSYSLFLPAKTY